MYTHRYLGQRDVTVSSSPRDHRQAAAIAGNLSALGWNVELRSVGEMQSDLDAVSQDSLLVRVVSGDTVLQSTAAHGECKYGREVFFVVCGSLAGPDDRSTTEPAGLALQLTCPAFGLGTDRQQGGGSHVINDASLDVGTRLSALQELSVDALLAGPESGARRDLRLLTHREDPVIGPLAAERLAAMRDEPTDELRALLASTTTFWVKVHLAFELQHRGVAVTEIIESSSLGPDLDEDDPYALWELRDRGRDLLRLGNTFGAVLLLLSDVSEDGFLADGSVTLIQEAFGAAGLRAAWRWLWPERTRLAAFDFGRFAEHLLASGLQNQALEAARFAPGHHRSAGVEAKCGNPDHMLDLWRAASTQRRSVDDRLELIGLLEEAELLHEIDVTGFDRDASPFDRVRLANAIRSARPEVAAPVLCSVALDAGVRVDIRNRAAAGVVACGDQLGMREIATAAVDPWVRARAAAGLGADDAASCLADLLSKNRDELGDGLWNHLERFRPST